jgi:hypothetical protein
MKRVVLTVLALLALAPASAASAEPIAQTFDAPVANAGGGSEVERRLLAAIGRAL